MATKKTLQPYNLDFISPKRLPPPDKNMYRRKGNKDLPLPMRLPAPLKPSTKKSAKLSSLASLPSTYNNTNNSSTSGLLTTNIFPTTKTITNFKTMSPPLSPKLPPIIVKSNKKKVTNKRCKRGTRRNKITKLCVPNEYYMKKMYTRREYKRCPNGQRRNPYNLKCEQQALFTRNYI